MVKKLFVQYFKLFLFWILVFDFQRIVFSIHNWNKFEGVSFGEWLGAFFYSIKLDLGTAGALVVLPALLLTLRLIADTKWINRFFYGILFFEALFVALIHSGEVNAYGEWNHKLTSRVFMHLGNPDEVFRTADYSMTIWYFVFLFLELVFAWKLMRFLFKFQDQISFKKWFIALPVAILSFGILGSSSFLLLRGGLQPIPMNINVATYSNNPISNDLSINSLYFFGKSYLLYNRSEIDEYMPKINPKLAKKITDDLMGYPKKHDNYFLKTNRPNVVFIVLEGWSGEAISCLSETNTDEVSHGVNSTPNFDKIANEGILFTNIFATSGTSEIGNSSIFSGFPGIPEVSITMQPEKHRKLRSLNQDLEAWGYNTNYMFSGDLKYGNIGGYFMDHGFDVVKDESDFPSDLPRGKLNFYDEDLYKFLVDAMNKSKQPFMHCAFTGSTHSPYDQPKAKRGQVFTGVESDFMNALVYSDEAMGKFIKNCRKQPWFDNTLFVFVADHGHPTPTVTNPSSSIYNHIPLLFWGNAIKEEYRGKKMNVLGSQADIAATLLYQMGGNADQYPWSKDLMNPNVPEFALHTITRGYGWITPKGNMTYEMQSAVFVEDNFPKNVRFKEHQNCFAFLTEVYGYYKSL
jgi:phosphoglycerol transferase MdoB-like AlkP superfamily enzyme